MPSQELFSGAGSFTAENRRKGQAGPPASRRHHTWQLSDSHGHLCPGQQHQQGACPYPTETGIRGTAPSLSGVGGWWEVARASSASLGFTSQPHSAMGASLCASPVKPRPAEQRCPPVPHRLWAGGPLLRRKQMGVQGHFIPLEIHRDRAPLPWCPPGCRGCHQSCACPSWRHHVTVYSSSRWFLQI